MVMRTRRLSPGPSLFERLRDLDPRPILDQEPYRERGIRGVIRRRIGQPVSWAVHGLAHCLFQSYEVLDRAKVSRDYKRPIIFYANHGSYLDPGLFGSAVTMARGRRPWSVASATLYGESKLFHAIFPYLGAVPFSRRLGNENDAFASVSPLAALLKARRDINIFIEGTMPGNLQGSADGIWSLRSDVEKGTGLLRAHPFVAMLAYVANGYVQPVGISGAGRALPPEMLPGKLDFPGTWPLLRSFKNHRITLRFGDAIDVSRELIPKGANPQPSRTDFMRFTNDRMMPALSALVDFTRQDPPVAVAPTQKPLDETYYAAVRDMEAAMARRLKQENRNPEYVQKVLGKDVP